MSVLASMTAADLGVLIGAAATALSALTAWTATIVKLTRVSRNVDAINRAVNHQPPEEPPLVERIKNLEAGQRSHSDRQQLDLLVVRQRLDDLTVAVAEHAAKHDESLAELRRDVRSLGARHKENP